MSANLTGFVATGLRTMFGLGNGFVRTATYVRPASLNPSTGITITLEVTASCSIFVAEFKSRELGLLNPQPGDQKVYIRAFELSAITNPVQGDYIVETVSGTRRDITALPKLDATGQLWTFQTTITLNLDWGTVVDAAGANTDDWGDLTAWTTDDDWGSVV